MPRDAPSERHSWLLQRRSVLSRRQFKLLFVALCVPSLTVAASFLWWGYWYMLAYSVMELSVVGLCLRYHLRHAADFDRIDISSSAIMVAQRRARAERRFLFNPYTTRLLPPGRECGALRLAGADGNVKLAEFLPLAQRRQLAQDIAGYLPR